MASNKEFLTDILDGVVAVQQFLSEGLSKESLSPGCEVQRKNALLALDTITKKIQSSHPSIRPRVNTPGKINKPILSPPIPATVLTKPPPIQEEDPSAEGSQLASGYLSFYPASGKQVDKELDENGEEQEMYEAMEASQQQQEDAGVDYEEDTLNKAEPSIATSNSSKQTSPSRTWHRCEKEQLTAERPHTRQQAVGSSCLYLASTAVMCLDVTILHRLFNLSAFVSRIGRFSVLLLVLVILVGFLLGGNTYSHEAEQMSVPPSEIEKVRRQLQSDMDILSTQLDAAVKNSANKVDVISQNEMDKLRGQVQADISSFSAQLDHLKQGNLEDIQSQISRIETMMKENENKVDAVPRSEMEKLRVQFQTDIDNFSAHLDSLKQENVEGIRKELNHLETQMKDNANKVDKIPQTEVEKLKGQFQADVVRLTARLDSLKHRKSEEIREASRKTEQMIADLKAELLKNMADDSLDLRQWVIHSTVSSDNLKDLERRVDTILNYTVDGVDILRQDIRQMIDQSLQAYNADRVGSFDFALENAGGSVVLDRCSSTYSHSVAQLSLFGFTLWHVPSSPKVIIQPSLYPGDCWAMEGQSGFATIKMSAEAIVTAVTVDHIPRELTPNGSLNSAPKAFTVFGLPDLDGEEISLGSYTYDLYGPDIQTFYIDESLQKRSSQYVRLAFSSNHGNKDYTCLYRVRVHGHYF